MTDEIDPFHVKGGDGVIRPLHEHYDGMKDVQEDPYGAWLAIQNLSARLAEVEARDAEGTRLMLGAQKRMREYKARAEAAEAKLEKVLVFLRFLDENYRHAFGDTARQKIRELYAELKGEKDDSCPEASSF